MCTRVFDRIPLAYRREDQSVSGFIFLASAYEGGWTVLSITVSSFFLYFLFVFHFQTNRTQHDYRYSMSGRSQAIASACTVVHCSILTPSLTVSGGASPMLMAGHRHVISRISKGSQNILIYIFMITTVDCQVGSQGGGISARAFAPARPGVAPPLLTVRLV